MTRSVENAPIAVRTAVGGMQIRPPIERGASIIRGATGPGKAHRRPGWVDRTIALVHEHVGQGA
ncbi:MAG: hypothetical protein ABSF84_05910 [Acidimicrobiales bacterium]|jgi:hypothetical protein